MIYYIVQLFISYTNMLLFMNYLGDTILITISNVKVFFEKKQK